MVRIYEDPKTSEVVVWTTATTVDAFMHELAAALATINTKDRDIAISETLKHAFPLAFKLAGYKADDVYEERTLYHGTVSPAYCKVLGQGE